MNALALLRLARTEGVGPVGFRRLLARHGTAETALRHLPDLARAAGRATPLRVCAEADAARELARLERLGGRMLFLGEPDYPPLLAELPDAPPALALLGDVALLAARSVAVVGGRNASLNGQRIAADLAAGLAESGLVVVSGLARGVDAAAHKAALAAGRTIAAIAGGIDIAYPPENTALQAEIASQGALLAESPFGTAPLARHFPRRNRVIAGLVLGVVVVEAAPRSGSLITARLALEAGREVFAVPGSPLDPRCRGSNDLIRQGATLTETIADILGQLDAPPLLTRRAGLAEPPPPSPSDSAPLDPEQAAKAAARVLELLGPSPCPVDDLIRGCQLSAATILSVLLDLELAGRIEMLPGQRVALLA